MRQMLGAAAALFGLNAYVVLRLFTVGTYRHMNTVEGLMVGLTRFTAANWGDLTWLPLYFCGMPFHQVYAPGVPVAAAAVASLTHWDAIRAYHFTLALLYCLGPPLLFWVAWRLSGRFWAAWCAGLMWSLVSPSCLLMPSVALDNGHVLFNRRLHSIVDWGDGPNAVMLAFAMLAVAAIHAAVTTRRPIAYAGAVASFGIVMLSSWPASVVMILAISCYVVALPPAKWRPVALRIAAIAVISYAVIAPWIPPSTLFSTFDRSGSMNGAYPPGQGFARAAAALGLLAVFALTRWAMGRAPFWFRFAAQFTLLTGGVALIYEYSKIVLVTQAIRFHLPMEIGISLTTAFAASLLLHRRKKAQYAMAVLVVALSVWLTILARRHARVETAAADGATMIEAETANWFARNLSGDRVWTTGSISFWLDALSDTPQLAGCCEQSNMNPTLDMARYELVIDGSSENRQLWVRALGVHAFSVGGRNSREPYKDVHHAEALIGSSDCPWQDGDDYICVVPGRAHSLAHVMMHADLASRAPSGGIDAEPLRSYVAALENPAYPVANLRWPNNHTAKVDLNLNPEQILSLQVTYYPGWRATANRRTVPVQRDNLGFMYVEPGCDGACSIELIYDGGLESRLLWWLRAVTLLGAAGWVIYAGLVDRR